MFEKYFFTKLFRPWKHPNQIIRRNAVLSNNLSQKVLEDIYKNDIHWSVRRAAINKMSNKSLLEFAKGNDDENNVRIAARDRLEYLQYIENKKDNTLKSYSISNECPSQQDFQNSVPCIKCHKTMLFKNSEITKTNEGLVVQCPHCLTLNRLSSMSAGRL